MAQDTAEAGAPLRRMEVDPLAIREAAEAAALATLRGGVVLAPTDTVYGLHCHPFQPAALQRLLDAKRRAEDKGFLLLIPDAGWVEELCPQPPPFMAELSALIWPGPVTVLAAGHPSLSPLILGREGKVGMRWPENPLLAAWMEEISAPLVSSSANLAGEPIPESLQALRKLFEGSVELILEGDEPAPAPPSSVLDLTADPPRIVRRGAGVERLEEALASLGVHFFPM